MTDDYAPKVVMHYNPSVIAIVTYWLQRTMSSNTWSVSTPLTRAFAGDPFEGHTVIEFEKERHKTLFLMHFGSKYKLFDTDEELEEYSLSRLKELQQMNSTVVGFKRGEISAFISSGGGGIGLRKVR